MNTPHTPQDLDTALRQGARARRTLLDEQRYPVGDYSPRPRNTTDENSLFRGRGRGVGVVLRGAWMLGLSGGITAVLLLGLAGVLQFMAPPQTDSATFDSPGADTLVESVGTLVTQIQKAEQTLSQRLDPTFRLATAWPGHVQAFSESLGQSPTTLPAPIEDEITAIRHDLLAAADYVRQQWRAPTPATGIQDNPPNSGGSGPPTGHFPRPFGSAWGTAAG